MSNNEGNAMEKTKLLLVEDDENNLKLVRHFLKDIDFFEILTAKNGLQGLELLKKEFIPIIVTDLMMPEMDGFQMIEEAKRSPEVQRKENIDQIFVVISALNRHEDIHRAITLGAYDVLPKPLDRDFFAAKIKNYYNLHRLMKESEERYQRAKKLNEEILESYENRQLENRALVEAIQLQKEIYRKQEESIKKIQSLAASECKNGKTILEECDAFLDMENLGK
jgi:CheY-like chemotaxis protein